VRAVYTQRRATDKYDGKVEGAFPANDFRKCVDYLSGILEGVEFDQDDLEDIVRAALLRRRKTESI
jgi:hypothetical protein